MEFTGEKPRLREGWLFRNPNVVALVIAHELDMVSAILLYGVPTSLPGVSISRSPLFPTMLTDPHRHPPIQYLLFNAIFEQTVFNARSSSKIASALISFQMTAPLFAALVLDPAFTSRKSEILLVTFGSSDCNDVDVCRCRVFFFCAFGMLYSFSLLFLTVFLPCRSAQLMLRHKRSFRLSYWC